MVSQRVSCVYHAVLEEQAGEELLGSAVPWTSVPFVMHEGLRAKLTWGLTS